VTAGLKSGEWEKAKSLLYENKALFVARLSKPQQDDAAALVVFFNRIDEGDRLIEAMPQTTESLDKAVESYGRAQEQAGGLDVGFIKQEKIKSASARQAALKTQQQKELASGRYALVSAALMSGEWEKARIRLYENRSLFTAHLAKPQQDEAAALAVFFNRIDEGDRLAAEAPETVKSLDKAVEAFGQAPEKAGGLDVGYIRKEKIGLIMARQATLKEQQQKEQQLKEQQLKEQQLKEQQLKEQQEKEQKLKEQAVREAVKEPVLPPEKTAAEKPATYQAGSVSGVKQAVIDFSEKRYTSAFNNFMTVYGMQITGIQKGGSGYIKGVLGLPPRYRAEILFLVEFERLREKSNNDTEAIRTGLEELFGNIEGMQGPWAIITEDKRTLIKRHINEFK
jgi:predicted SpoU family rRNA methylase